VALLIAIVPAGAAPLRCAADAVMVGNACVDKYAASVWPIAPSNKELVAKVQRGQATLAALTEGGATQLSPTPSCTPAYPGNFPRTGDWTPVPGSSPSSPGLYAASIPGVPPSACLTWFQAEQVCVTSGKRLATNQEWQRAASATQETFNSVGNVREWVGDPGSLGGPGAGYSNLASALFRSRHWYFGTLPGVLAANNNLFFPSNSNLGFRCAR
jgi:formylglycine-generating enzyme required for sulfatase activity